MLTIYAYTPRVRHVYHAAHAREEAHLVLEQLRHRLGGAFAGHIYAAAAAEKPDA